MFATMLPSSGPLKACSCVEFALSHETAVAKNFTELTHLFDCHGSR